MKRTLGWLSVWTIMAFAASVSFSSPAIAAPKLLTVEVDDPISTVTSKTLVEALDASGTVTTCPLLNLKKSWDTGTFKCNLSTGVSPFLLTEKPASSGQPLFGIAQLAVGNANINPLTSIGVEQAYLALSTSAALQWSFPTLPLTPPMVGSSLGWMDHAFAQPMVAYKFTPELALTYDYYTAKLTSNFSKMMKQFAFTGIGGTGPQTAQITLPGSIDFNALMTPHPSPTATSVDWTATASTGVSYFHDYAKYPTNADATAIYTQALGYYFDYLAILKHEGGLLDAPDLSPTFSSLYFGDGNVATTQEGLDATRLRPIKVLGFALGTINSLQDDVPVSGSSLIRLNVLRLSTNKGVPCIDECCDSLVCSSGICLNYGNQLLARVSQDFVSETDSIGGTPTTSSYLNASASTPNGTLSGLTIEDQYSIYFSTPIPYIKTRDIPYKPYHNLAGSTLPYDFFNLHTDFTPPVPPTDKFTVDFFPTIGTSPSTTLFPPPTTTELINLTKGPEGLGDTVGKTVDLGWKPLLSILVNSQFVYGDECTATQTQRVMSKPLVLTWNSLKASLKYDLKLGGDAITGTDFTIEERSLQGLTVRNHAAFGTSCSF